MRRRELVTTVAASRPVYPMRGGRLCAALLPLAASLGACAVPNLYSVEEDRLIGEQAYQEVLAAERVAPSGPESEMVERVMRRLVAVLDDDPGFDWEVRLIDNDQVANAWALPGGKMAVYSGLLPLAETEAGLATVMAHELAHATERHGTERMSQEVFSQTGVGLLLETAGASAEWADVASLAKDLLISLPYGREQELEADRKGLRYMAAAGYDPREAVAFWRRMSSGGGGGSIELLSTHPSDQRRMDQLEALMGDALAIYEKRRPEGVLGRP